ncbi:uncharacterized protein LDX57_003207 [Aspergillus melleus]|uniref:uncharacterized protein n=1 Tax=Aspergillus melleus TaxID=138277 RepID=UPI001E8E41D7|nr:uncharacterized protein LDX57_003207 [Aspergillus melleus]KAH8425454.1 hypothetical protein LDX57_003207 [Aspergillus melleus]
MSTAHQSNPPGEAKPEGLSKYIKRMRTVFRRSSTAKSGSGSPSNVEGKAESGEAKQVAGPTATPKPTVTTPAPKPTPAATPPADQPIVVSHWSAIQEARTRALFAKHGLSLNDDDLKPTDTVQRVAKPIRMRVRRSCHRCQTPFGSDRVCVNCQHTRCKSCPRHPPPRTKENPETAFRKLMAQKGKGVVSGKAPLQHQSQLGNPSRPKQINDGNRNEYVLRIPSRTGGQDLVRKPVMQRVRRTCHRCDKLFVAGSKQCAGCDHVRCKKCPRDPPKLDKYPDGYPGDVEPPVELPPRTWKKPRRRVRYTCHQCSTVYRSGQDICAICGQERCAETIREPPKRVKPEPDPEIFRKVEERLASLRLATE